jgi:predicted ribosome quality control (RQC) complex YloA/Tae2 family protein
VHLNYYFLKPLAAALHAQLKGKKFIESFSQEKDELILIFAAEEQEETLIEPFFIKAILTSHFACLFFPDGFQRARRNSVNLFTSLTHRVIEKIAVFENERAIGIWFEDGGVLVLKMYGNRSNIILFDRAHDVQEVFNHKLGADKLLDFSTLNREIDQSFEAYSAESYDYKPLFPTFGKLVQAELDRRLLDVFDPLDKWRVIEDVLQTLLQPRFYLIKVNNLPVLSLLPVGDETAVFEDPIQASNALYLAHMRINGIDKEKADILRIIHKRIQKTERYLENTFQKLVALEEGSRNDQIANIIMANLHQIPARAENVELFDFYHDQLIQVKLKKDLSPQKNAEGYYRKSKNEKIEIEKLNESLAVRESEIVQLQEDLSIITPLESLRELRAYIKSRGLLGGGEATSKDVASLFKKVIYEGFVILVGRNAKNNDLLTQQHAFKEDLWLHARDVTGSHVIIKHQAGKNFPRLVIERAAQLAAFYSKRRTESLCPVIYTPKKYVRKPKGLPDGAVVVDKEQVVMVEPKDVS